MRFYAERPLRALGQLLADVIVLAWVIGVAIVARAAHDLVMTLQKPAMALADAGGAVARAFGSAAETARGVPFVGGELARALGTGTDAGTTLASAGSDQVPAIRAAAMGVGIGLVVLAAVPVVLSWGSRRFRYARDAASAVDARRHGHDLLALRALTRQPTRLLLDVAAAPASAWREQDPDVMRRLAALELATLGLRPDPR